MSDRTMLNCGASGRVVFAYRCPLTWDALTPTDEPRERDCATCRRTVHWCSNLAEAAVRAGQGECIAVPAWLADGVRDLAEEQAKDRRVVVVGMPDLDHEASLLTAVVEAHDGPSGWRIR